MAFGSFFNRAPRIEKTDAQKEQDRKQALAGAAVLGAGALAAGAAYEIHTSDAALDARLNSPAPATAEAAQTNPTLGKSTESSPEPIVIARMGGEKATLDLANGQQSVDAPAVERSSVDVDAGERVSLEFPDTRVSIDAPDGGEHAEIDLKSPRYSIDTPTK